MERRGFIGIDFGTNNSHFAYCELSEGPIRATPILLDAAQGSASISTSVLWGHDAQGESIPIDYGDRALEEWVLLDEHERTRDGLRFATAFKPDIGVSASAREDARAFLRGAYEAMRGTRTPPWIGEREGMPVIIGVPAGIDEAHRTATLEIACQAGFGEARCLAEPLGALGYHLAHHQLTEEEVARGVVVVDFGGGTLDVALVDADGVREPWGDPRLGGRLFDDLFFQWVLDAGGVGLVDVTSTELMYGWWVGARQLKERFSTHWQQQLAAGKTTFGDFRGRVTLRDGVSLGVLREVGLDDFMARARAYRPSRIARDYFARIGSALEHLGADAPVDLLDWVRKAIGSGPRLAAERDYSNIILTGGGSRWPFMRTLVGEVFGVAPDAIRRAASPERTIGEGLAIYDVLRERYRVKRARLRADIPRLESGLAQEVARFTHRVGDAVADDILQEIMRIARLSFIAWHQLGGRLATVEAHVQQCCADLPVATIAEQRIQSMLPELETRVSAKLSAWLRDHQIERAAADTPLAGIGSIGAVELEVRVSDALAKTATGVAATTLSGTIVVAVIGTILATEATLLVLGPIGVVLAGAAGLGTLVARDRFETWVRNHRFGDRTTPILRRIFTEERLDKTLTEAGDRCRDTLRAAVAQAIAPVAPELERQAKSAAERALRHYGLLDRLV